MSARLVRTAGRIVRMWTRIYTAGMPPSLRDRRRAEIESDLWECSREPRHAAAAGQLLLRCVLGVADDLAWRNSSRVSSPVLRAFALAIAAAAVLAAGLVFSVARSAALPVPAPLAREMRAHPQPPPPPPPPCPPPRSGRVSPTPCVP